VSVTELTDDTYTETTARPGLVVVDFWATWCGPCKAFKPVFAAVAAANPDVTFATVDVDTAPAAAAAARISSVPTVLVFHDGQLVAQHAGPMPAPALTALLDKHR